MAYVYAYIIDGVARYIGKGTGNRDKYHLSCSENSLFHKYLRNRLKEGKVPIIKRWIENVSDEVAYDYEERFIKKIGKVIDSTGTLLNICNGGFGGTKGISKSKESIAKTALGNTGKKRTPEQIEKMRQTSLKYYRAYKEKYGEIKGTKKTPEQIERMRQSLLGKKHSVEHREKNRQAQLVRWGKIKKVDRKVSDKSKEKNRQSHLGKKSSEETKQKTSESMKKVWTERKREQAK